MMAKRKKTTKTEEPRGSAAVEEREVKPAGDTATQPVETDREYAEGIKKTVIPGVIGIIAGIILFAAIDDGTAHSDAWFSILFILLALAYYAQRLIYPSVGVNVRKFGKKDWLYVEFMVLDFSLVSWTILLNISS